MHFGAPGGNRTPDPQLRRLLLYPTELLAQAVSQVNKSCARVQRAQHIGLTGSDPDALQTLTHDGLTINQHGAQSNHQSVTTSSRFRCTRRKVLSPSI